MVIFYLLFPIPLDSNSKKKKRRRMNEERSGDEIEQERGQISPSEVATKVSDNVEGI